MDNKSNTFSYWTVVPGANVGKVPIPSRFVESTQGSERYRTVCHNDGDLKQGAKDFSLCMKHQQSTCRMGDRCHQLHVNPDFFDATKFWDEVRRTCCAKHADFNSRSDEFVQKLNSYRFEVMGVPGANSCCPVDSNMLARTAGLMEMIRTRPPNDPRPIQFSVRQICRLHINDECRFGRDCGRIHVCRDFVNRELPLPPVPRKKGKEGHLSSVPSQYNTADAGQQAAPTHTPNASSSLPSIPRPWMRHNAGAVGVHNTVQQMPQPMLSQLQQAAAVGALLSGHMPVLNTLDVNKMQQQQHAMMGGMVGGNVNPNLMGNAFRGVFPPGMMGMGRGGMENPGTPLSTTTPGSLPNVVRSVVDMTLTDEADVRRRQAAAFAALSLQANAQNLNPNSFLHQALRGNFAGKMEHLVGASNVSPNNNNANPNAHQVTASNSAPQPQQQPPQTFNPTTALSRPLGDLTNKGNANTQQTNNTANQSQTTNRGAIGGKVNGALGAENGERDYSMFAGKSLYPCPFSFDA